MSQLNTMNLPESPAAGPGAASVAIRLKPLNRWTALALAAALAAGPLAAWAQSDSQPAGMPDPAASASSAPAAAQPAASAPAAPLPVPTVEPLPPLAADGLDIEKEDRLQGLKKVALAGVAVYVMTEDSGGVTSGTAFQGYSMASVSASVKVVGLDSTRLQTLVDRIPAQVTAALQARGIEVMPQAQLEALPEFAALRAVSDATPLALDAKAGKGWVLAPQGLPAIHMDEGAWLHRVVGGLFGAKVDDPYVSLGDKMGVGFRKVKLDPALDALGKAAGVPLVFARVVLSAAQVKTSGGAWSFNAKAETRNSLVMPAWTNRLLVRQTNGDFGRVSLKKALASPQAVGELVDVTSTGTQVANALTTAFTMAAAFYGKGRAVNTSSQDMELRTSPELFEAIAAPQVAATLQGLALALKP
jgi:hypothetical protein